MSGTINRLRVAKGDPRLKELVPGTVVIINIRADMLIDEGEKYTNYLGGYDSDVVLSDFMLYREVPRWDAP